MADNPWRQDAEHITRIGSLTSNEKETLIPAISTALARAYEYGFAQGRLAEIDRERLASKPPRLVRYDPSEGGA